MRKDASDVNAVKSRLTTFASTWPRHAYRSGNTSGANRVAYFGL